MLIIIAVSGCTPVQEMRHPNIVLIMSDDQGWGDLSISGNTNLSTPNIDELAKTGVTFDRFYVSPVCSPTRAELLTGRHHVRGGVFSTSSGGERLNLDETTLAEVLKSAGYATAAYGKWHNGMQPPYHPNARGFDDYYGFCSGHWGNYFDPMLEHNGKIVKGKGFIIDDFTDHGLNFIEENKDQPFFLYLPYNTPHRPMQIPDEWWAKFENKTLVQTYQKPDEEDLLHTQSALALCENIDWNVGRIMTKLNELQLDENTIVIYLSDNGPNGWRWNGGMKGKKGSTDEGGVRSPMFMKWKGTLESGKKIREIASIMDLLPTLTDLAGINFIPSKPLDGQSLKPLLLGEPTDWKGRMLINHWNKKTSVRSQQYRLDDTGQLFDMISDPGQITNISGQYPDIAAQLMNAKTQWEKEVLTELPEKETRPFTLGHPEFIYTQLPARDGTAHENIKRSNRWPNSSYFTNWISTQDSITWEVEVLADGDYEVEIYYTCPAESVGSTFELRFANATINSTITEAHDPPLIGMDKERHPRGNSYVKDFKPLNIGILHLEKGRGLLTMKATEIPGSQVMDFRLLMFKKVAR